MGKLKPGRRTAMAHLQDGLVYYSFTFEFKAMREPVAASHFGRVCAGSITAQDASARIAPGGKWCNPINAFLTLPAVTKW
jgi:hypothetical protein